MKRRMKMSNGYRMCTYCVMDNASDDIISFDKEGRCNYCTNALKNMYKLYFPNAEGEKKIANLIRLLKKDGKGKQYDCLMGLSGGLDSSYLAYLGAARWGLRILAIHIDDGFDTELAKSNINKLCKKCNIELIVIKPDPKQFSDLTRSYILAEVPNIAIPQDNVLFACLYECVKKYSVNYFLSGGNFALESVLQSGNTYGAFDLTNLKDIHEKFGKQPIDKLPLLSNRDKKIDLYFNNIQTFHPLDFIDYNKQKAIRELADFCDFAYYEAKHLENTLTKIIQLYWFYNKFHVDKRRSHFSSLIVSGQMSREEALLELSKPLYDNQKIEEEIRSVLDKLDISYEEFQTIVNRKGKQHTDYKTEPSPNIFTKIFWALVHRINLLNNKFFS